MKNLKKSAPSLAVAIAMALSLMTAPAGAVMEIQPVKGKTPFTDVPAGSYSELPVLWALESSAVTGTSATTFSPEKVCSLSELWTVLYRLAGKPVFGVFVENAWKQVSPDRWDYYPALYASALKCATTAATKVDPSMLAVNRGYMVWSLWKALGANDVGTDFGMPFTDVSEFTTTMGIPHGELIKAIRWAVANYIVTGTGDGTTFSPELYMDRAQMVAFLSRAYGPHLCQG